MPRLARADGGSPYCSASPRTWYSSGSRGPITFWSGGETRSGFNSAQGSEAGFPYATYSWAELFTVPVGVLVVIALAIARRTRPWALWALLGTLGALRRC